MLVNSHPDVTGAMAAERAARLLAEAKVERARRTVAQWRPARFRQPTPDLQRAAPAHEPAATADRAA
jgi:hypothetical protein